MSAVHLQLHAHGCAGISEEAHERTARHCLLLLIGLEATTTSIVVVLSRPPALTSVEGGWYGAATHRLTSIVIVCD